MSDEEDEEYTEELFVTQIKSSKYDEVKPSEVADEREHLSENQKKDLTELLSY